jgi:hypothetical protein
MTLFQQVIELCTPYFGSPAQAEQFLARQCKAHLNREPTALTPHDLWELSKWAMISGSLVMGKGKSEELSEKILQLRRSMGSLPLGR